MQKWTKEELEFVKNNLNLTDNDSFMINRKINSIFKFINLSFANENKNHGVCKEKNKFVARIQYNKIPIRIGIFNSIEEAAKAYDKKAFELFGENAKLNFPEEYFE